MKAAWCYRGNHGDQKRENGTFYLRGKDQKVLWRTENESKGVKLELLLLQNDGNLAG